MKSYEVPYHLKIKLMDVFLIDTLQGHRNAVVHSWASALAAAARQNSRYLRRAHVRARVYEHH